MKRYFSRIGLMYLIGGFLAMGVQWGISCVIQNAAPQLALNFNLYFLARMIHLYLLGYPIMIALIKTVKVNGEVPEKHKMTFGQLLTAFCMCYALGFISNFMGVILTGIIGAIKGSTVQNVLMDVAFNLHPVTAFVIMVLGAPIAEELIFRKLLVDRVVPYGEGIAIVLSGIMFGLFHGNLNQAVYAFTIGCFFAFIYVRTRKIRYTIALHMMINFMGSVAGLLILKQSGYLKIAKNLNTLTETQMMHLVMNNLSGLAVYMLYVVLLMVIVLAGVILLILKRKQFYLKPAEQELAKKERFSVVFLNIGMGLYCLYWTGQIVLQLLQ